MTAQDIIPGSGPGDPAVQGAPPASASAVDVITLDDELTTSNVPSSPKTCRVHSLHACDADAGAQPGPDCDAQVVKDLHAVARMERSARRALACCD
eukprot:36223-Chlamydomonas_euryale.AAC.7